MLTIGGHTGLWAERGYLSFLNAEEAIVKRWGTNAYPMLLEFALFEPYSAVLARKSKDLSARKDYAEFWFRVAVSITPKDKQTSRRLAEVIEHVSTDTNRRGGIRAIAMERLAQVAEEPGQMQPVFGNTVSKEDLLRGTALHALGIWAARHLSATDEALADNVKEAIRKLERAVEHDTAPWIKKACRAALGRIVSARREAQANE